jgi:hypothetical protein
MANTNYQRAVANLSPIVWLKLDEVGLESGSAPFNSGSFSSTNFSPTKDTFRSSTDPTRVTGFQGFHAYDFGSTGGKTRYLWDQVLPSNTFVGREFSFAFWYKASTQTTVLAPTMFRADSATANFIILRTQASDHPTTDRRNKMRFQVGGNTTNISINSTNDIVDGNWHHVVCTCEVVSSTNTRLRIYIDGSLDTSSSSTNIGTFTTIDNSGVKRYLFDADDNDTNHTLTGTIDEFAIFSATLTSNEVTNLYNAGFKVEFETTAAEASALLPAPSPMIAEINDAGVMQASAEFRGGSAGTPVTIDSSPMVAEALMTDVDLELEFNLNFSAPLFEASAEFVRPEQSTIINVSRAIASAKMGYNYTNFQGPLKDYDVLVAEKNPVWWFPFNSSNLASVNKGFFTSQIGIRSKHPSPPGVNSSFDAGYVGRGVAFPARNDTKDAGSGSGNNEILDRTFPAYGPIDIVASQAEAKSLNININSSIEFWIKPDKFYSNGDLIPSSQIEGYLFTIPEARGTRSNKPEQRIRLLAVEGNDDVMKIEISAYGTSSSGPRPEMFVFKDRWTHVVFTYEYINKDFRNRVIAYRNGERLQGWDLFNTRSIIPSIVNPFRVIMGNGYYAWGSQQGVWHCSMDEFAFYQTTLSASDVYRHYISANTKNILVDPMNAFADIILPEEVAKIINVDSMSASAEFKDAVQSNDPIFIVSVNASMQANAWIERSIRPYINVYWDKISMLNRRSRFDTHFPEEGQNDKFSAYNMLDFGSDIADPGGGTLTGGFSYPDFSGYQMVYSLGGDLRPGRKNTVFEYTIGTGAFGGGLDDDNMGFEVEGRVIKANEDLPGIFYRSDNGPAGRQMAEFNGNFWLYFQQQSNLTSNDPGLPLGNNSEVLGSYAGHQQLTFNTIQENSTLICTTPFLTYPKGPVSQLPNFAVIGDVLYKDRDDGNDFIKKQRQVIYLNQTFIELEDGKIVLNHLNVETYKRYKIKGSTYLADGKNHHLIVNRTWDGIGDSNGNNKEKRSCLEIWIDGKLEVRSFEFNDQEWQSYPNFLGAKFHWRWLGADFYQRLAPLSGDTDGFGAAVPAASGFQTETIFRPNFNAYVVYVNNDSIFKGRMSDYVYAPNKPLTGNQIEELWQAWQGIIPIETGDWRARGNTEDLSFFKSSAEMISPKVSTNQKGLLRLYWSDINTDYKGISPQDDIFRVETCSVNAKLKTNYLETYNFNFSEKDKYVQKEDVKIVIDRHISVLAPGAIVVAIPVRGRVGAAAKPIDPRTSYPRDTISYTNWGNLDKVINQKIEIVEGDRVLLINQPDKTKNGVWEYRGPMKSMFRPKDLDNAIKIYKSTVYVQQGDYERTYWTCTNELDEIEFQEDLSIGLSSGYDRPIEYKKIDTTITNELDNSCPIIEGLWRSELEDLPRLIDLEKDINIDDYEIISFVNYPKTINELQDYFKDFDAFYVRKIYNNFLESIKNVVEKGKSLFITSEKLLEDLKLVTNVEEVDQLFLNVDLESADKNVFESDNNVENYFDTHRNIRYRIVDTEENLTTRSNFFILSDAIYHKPTQNYHLKYSYLENNLDIGDEFYIPTLALTEKQLEYYTFEYSNNIKNKKLYGFKEENMVYGKAIATFSSTIHNGIENPYKDYINTAIVKDFAWEKEIQGKIFINLVEDSLTSTQFYYNEAMIQDIDEILNENEYQLEWQYSTSRLENLKNTLLVNLDDQIQQYPSFVGGGALIQMPTNFSDGKLINKNNIPDNATNKRLYFSKENEKYGLIEIEIYSLSYLGLLWLGGL